MTEDTKKKIQLGLAVVIVITAARAGYILYQRHEDYAAAEKQKQAKNIGYANQDYYVTPKKLHPYDIDSARQLTQQPVWVKEGYRYTYFRYVPVVKSVDFHHDAGTLGPLERLQIKDVLAVSAPGGRKQVVALFDKDEHNFAVPIGYETDSGYKIYSDEMFYIEDPHDLYEHWPADVWQAVEQHQIKPGMNELQADFAVGMGTPDGGATAEEKTVHYPNGGNPLVVTYHEGKAAEIKAGS